MDTLNGTKKENTMFLNPMIKKLTKLQETSDTVSTYSGIFSKCLYFMIMIMAGVVIALALNNWSAMTVDATTGELYATYGLFIGLMISAVVFLVVPFIAFLIRATIPVTGALYCASTGYVLTCMALFDTEMGGYVLLALALTLAIVAVMGVLFARGIIKVTQKFRAVTTTLFGTVCVGSVLMLICYLIPALRGAVTSLMDNVLVSVGLGVLGVIIAALFLLVDFDTIRQTVENRLPKKYEWFAAFGMVFTVVWLYFKVLSLISKMKD